MEHTTEITIGTLYDLLNEFKRDVHRRFEAIERRQEEDHKLLMELWQQREQVTVKFSKFQFVSFGAVMLTTSFILGTLMTLFIHFTL